MGKRAKKDDNNIFFSYAGNYLVVLLLKAVALLPLGIIYALSDFLFFLNRHFIQYRYKVSTENLKAAFPEKTEEEICEIRTRFYRHFFDFSLESVKLYNMSEADMGKHIVFNGFDKLEALGGERYGCIVLAFHHNNWEWCSYGQRHLRHPVLMVYNPPRYNKPMEDFLLKSRGKWGGKVVRTNFAARYAINYKQKEIPAVLWLAADQRALARSPFWINFLNREAAFFSGPQQLAKKLNHPVFFQHIRKVARGKYEASYTLLINEPAKLETDEILRIYVQKMEEVIKSEPEYYLWSHKRWKHKRPANIPLIE